MEHLLGDGELPGDLQVLLAELPASPLSVPTVADVRKAACSFPWGTGTSADRVSPRAFSMLSDDALAYMIYVMWATESWHRWPSQMMAHV